VCERERERERERESVALVASTESRKSNTHTHTHTHIHTRRVDGNVLVPFVGDLLKLSGWSECLSFACVCVCVRGRENVCSIGFYEEPVGMYVCSNYYRRRLVPFPVDVCYTIFEDHSPGEVWFEGGKKGMRKWKDTHESHLAYTNVLQCVALCCGVLQCAAVCCSVLQCGAVCCSVLQCESKVIH